jgi:serine/threonine protein kinase
VYFGYFDQLTMASDQPITKFSFMEDPMGLDSWMSPELINPERFGLQEYHPTKESDQYALGMVIYEVLSGQAPFAPYEYTTAVLKIVEGERPERPQGEEGRLFTDDIWDTLGLCWKHQPHDRISASAVLLRLEGHPPLLPSSNVGGDVGTGGDDWSESDSDASDCKFLYFIPGLSLIPLASYRTADCTL